MEVYLVNKETNEILRTFTDVKSWNETFVEFKNGGFRSKIYCGENEYFTNVIADD